MPSLSFRFFFLGHNNIILVVGILLLILSLLVPSTFGQQTAQTTTNYTYSSLRKCTLDTQELAKLGPDDELEPCIISTVLPYQWQSDNPSHTYSVIPVVQVTPSGCNNHRDGAVTGVESLNSDNGGKGVEIGFNQTHFIRFFFVSVVAGNPASLSEGEYDRRHDQILRSMITELNAPYIIGTCSFASAVEKAPAKDLKAIVLTQVGPPGFYTDNNPYVFGFHINSDTYPLPNVQVLDFLAADMSGGPASVPVKVIYRTKSEFFYSTCRSAIDQLAIAGFTDVTELLYDHAADDDKDGDTNQFDEDFLQGLADVACPPGSDSTYHPALFLCTLTEQDIILDRLLQNGCRPISTWVTAATWGWANNNLNVVPYFQGGGQWHEAMRYNDRYFQSGRDVILLNERKFGYIGNYDQVVSYAMPILYAQHLQAAYRVSDAPDPLADFATEEGRERLRRAMVVLNVETIFGPVAFNEYQRNIGRGAAGTQWLPLLPDGRYTNALVSPFLQAEASTVIPALSAQPCPAGSFINDTLRMEERSVLANGCNECPIDFFSKDPTYEFSCRACPMGSSTDESTGSTSCLAIDDNLLPLGVQIFGYTAVAITWLVAIGFFIWMLHNRTDPVVKVSQVEFLGLICLGPIISSATIIALSAQAGHDDDASSASTACSMAPFLYCIGWTMMYSSLNAKTIRLYKVMENNAAMRRVTVTALQMSRVVLVHMSIDLIIVIAWTIVSPLVYERSELGTNVNEETGVETIQSVGRCVNQNEDIGFWVFAGPLVAHHLMLIVGTNYLLYQVRDITDRYQEQKYLALASMLLFELLLVGVPVMVAVNDSPSATFVVLTGIIAFGDTGTLCFIFIPKIKFKAKGLQEGVGFGESIMRESHRNATTREFSRRSVTISQQPLRDSYLQQSRSSQGMSSLGRLNSGVDSIAEETSDELGKEASSKALKPESAKKSNPRHSSSNSSSSDHSPKNRVYAKDDSDSGIEGEGGEMSVHAKAALTRKRAIETARLRKSLSQSDSQNGSQKGMELSQNDSGGGGSSQGDEMSEHERMKQRLLGTAMWNTKPHSPAEVADEGVSEQPSEGQTGRQIESNLVDDPSGSQRQSNPNDNDANSSGQGDQMSEHERMKQRLLSSAMWTAKPQSPVKVPDEGVPEQQSQDTSMMTKVVDKTTPHSPPSDSVADILKLGAETGAPVSSNDPPTSQSNNADLGQFSGGPFVDPEDTSREPLNTMGSIESASNNTAAIATLATEPTNVSAATNATESVELEPPVTPPRPPPPPPTENSSFGAESPVFTGFQKALSASNGNLDRAPSVRTMDMTGGISVVETTQSVPAPNGNLDRGSSILKMDMTGGISVVETTQSVPTPSAGEASSLPPSTSKSYDVTTVVTEDESDSSDGQQVVKERNGDTN